ncbi:unnamed protein product, partial [Scytosiphon promiscuus]
MKTLLTPKSARHTHVLPAPTVLPLSLIPLNGSDWQKQQEISACDSSVHYGFHPNVGRGAPEIDIMETMAGSGPGVRGIF